MKKSILIIFVAVVFLTLTCLILEGYANEQTNEARRVMWESRLLAIQAGATQNELASVSANAPIINSEGAGVTELDNTSAKASAVPTATKEAISEKAKPWWAISFSTFLLLLIGLVIIVVIIYAIIRKVLLNRSKWSDYLLLFAIGLLISFSATDSMAFLGIGDTEQLKQQVEMNTASLGYQQLALKKIIEPYNKALQTYKAVDMADLMAKMQAKASSEAGEAADKKIAALVTANKKLQKDNKNILASSRADTEALLLAFGADSSEVRSYFASSDSIARATLLKKVVERQMEQKVNTAVNIAIQPINERLAKAEQNAQTALDTAKNTLDKIESQLAGIKMSASKTRLNDRDLLARH